MTNHHHQATKRKKNLVIVCMSVCVLCFYCARIKWCPDLTVIATVVFVVVVVVDIYLWMWGWFLIIVSACLSACLFVSFFSTLDTPLNIIISFFLVIVCSIMVRVYWIGRFVSVEYICTQKKRKNNKPKWEIGLLLACLFFWL